jgi:two-component system phosphate regulon sensor histidine kinase PhoR
MEGHRRTVLFIATIVLLTIGIQVYWNFLHYANNRKQVINDIKLILDDVTKEYTNSHSKANVYKNQDKGTEIVDSSTDSIQRIVNKVLEEFRKDQQPNILDNNSPSISYNVIDVEINLNEFDSILEQELKHHNYTIDYCLKASYNGLTSDSLGKVSKGFSTLHASSVVAPIESGYVVIMDYNDPVLPSLMKGLTGIILSFILCCIVIFALYYLLEIIKKQKELSEIRHDFISNVTHEFKTPIATVTSALEAIKNFNNEQISDKTKRYLDISEQQLKKLNMMVEKVMETSLLESSELQLDFLKHDLVKLIKDCVQKNQLNTGKNIIFESAINTLDCQLDEFHFENAVSNLIDNAIKYGGNKITVSITKDGEEQVQISVQDNGEGISKQDEPFVFDKFYRARSKSFQIIKGFGIGLYYTKNIIKKHNGTIELITPKKFLITLWIL